MASLFKRGDSYYLSFYNSHQRPKRKQVPLKTRSKRTAEQLQRRMEDAYALGEYNPWCDEIELDTPKLGTLSEAIDAFMESRANLRPATIKKYKDVLNIFRSFLSPDFPIAGITTRHIEQFLNAGKRKPITKKTYSTALSPVFNWLIQQGALTSNPVKDIRLERVPTKFPKFLTPDDVERLCGLIAKHEGEQGTWLINPIRANVYLGLRLGELVNLQWEHIDLEGRTLTVANGDGFSTKSGKERRIPLCDAVLKVLKSLPKAGQYVFLSLNGVQLSKQYTSRRYSYYAGLLCLEAKTFHSTRHTAASWLAQQGCGVEAIRLYMGHSSITVTQKYMHLSPAAHFQQINQAFSSL